MFRWRRSLFGLGATFPRLTLGKENKTPAPLWILAGCAVFAMAAYAAPVLIPLVAAVMLYYLFAPLKRRFDRRGAHPLFLAVAAPAGIVVVLFAGFTFLAGPVSGWLEKAPSMVGRLQQHVDGLMRPVEKMREATGQVEKIARPESGQPGQSEVTVKPRSPVKPVTIERKPGSFRKSCTFCRACARTRSRSSGSEAVIQVRAITPGGRLLPEATRCT